MTDDLVKRLRMVTGFIRFETGDRIAASACLSEEAADRIQELEVRLAKVEAVLELYQELDAISVDAVNSLTAKLAKAVEGLWHYSCDCGDLCEGTGSCGDYARVTLTQIGEGHD
jgi:hypothetical protein